MVNTALEQFAFFLEDHNYNYDIPNDDVLLIGFHTKAGHLKQTLKFSEKTNRVHIYSWGDLIVPENHWNSVYKIINQYNRKINFAKCFIDSANGQLTITANGYYSEDYSGIMKVIWA